MGGIHSDGFEYNFVSLFLWVCEVKNIEDIKSLVPLQVILAVRMKFLHFNFLFRNTPQCKPKAPIAGSGILLIPHRFLGYFPVCELVLCCSQLFPVAVLFLGSSSSYWHSLPFRKLLTLQGEKHRNGCWKRLEFVRRVP